LLPPAAALRAAALPTPPPCPPARARARRLARARPLRRASPARRRAPQVLALRQASEHLPADYLVVLVGDMVTEEALPSYMNMLNLLDGTK
jgi:hypothetical protein